MCGVLVNYYHLAVFFNYYICRKNLTDNSERNICINGFVCFVFRKTCFFICAADKSVVFGVFLRQIVVKRRRNFFGIFAFSEKAFFCEEIFFCKRIFLLKNFILFGNAFFFKKAFFFRNTFAF